MPAPKIKNNLGDMKANLRGGVLRPHLYEVTIMGAGFDAAANKIGSEPGPVGLQGKKLITLNCEIASLPGSALSTNPYRIYGPVRETVYERLYSGDLTLTFRLDSEMWIRKLFNAWQNITYIPETGDFDYYDNYISDIEVYQYPTTQASAQPGNMVEVPPEPPPLKPIYGVRIKEAYPKSIGAIELGYETRDTYNKQTVEFAYRNWEEIPADEL